MTLGATTTTDRPSYLPTVVGSFRPDIIAGVLQSFRSDYPWQGAKTRQYQQIGNAVPPRLAAHVIAEAIGLDRAAVLENIATYYEESRTEIAARRTA